MEGAPDSGAGGETRGGSSEGTTSAKSTHAYNAIRFPAHLTTSSHTERKTVEVTIHPISSVQQEAEIQVSTTELQPLFDKAYEKYRKKVEIKGFRKGKAPLEMIKRMYGPVIEHESLDDAADQFYKQAMQERNIRPIGQPKLVDMNLKDDRSFWFKIAYETRPEVTLKKYKGIAAEKPVHTIADEEVNAEIEYLRRANSTSTEVPAVTDEHHVVIADVQELDDAGTPLIGRKNQGARFVLFDTGVPQEIRSALAQAEIGGTYKATFTTQHEDHSHAMAVAITPTKIEKVVLPAFDADFVKKITKDKVSTAEEFLSNLRTDLARYWDEQSERKVRDAVADEIVRSHEFDVPDSLVESFLDAFLEDIKNRSRDRQLPKGFDTNKFREESKATAVWQSKWMLLKEAIAEKENITVTDEDMDKLAAAEAARTGIDKDRLLQYYKSSGSASERLLSEKIMSFLREKAEVKEVPEQPAKEPVARV